jgi:hypothetical protein
MVQCGFDRRTCGGRHSLATDRLAWSLHVASNAFAPFVRGRTLSGRSLSDFRRLFFRVRWRPSANRPERHCADFSIVRARLKARATSYARDRLMQRGNSVLLRSFFSAAIVCAILRAATLSAADRAGSLPNGSVRETGPILVRSVSTIKMPVCSATRSLISEPATVTAEGHGEAALQSCVNVAPLIHDSSKPTRKPPRIVALAFLNRASP